MNPKEIISHSKPTLSDQDYRAVQAALQSGMIAEGALVAEFEENVSRFLQAAGGVATPNGTLALILGLKALNISPGDEVIMPTYVCRSVWDAVTAVGATPVLCDIGDDWCADTGTITPHITSKTKAIIVVHPFGIVADVKQILSLGIPVVEDCCQAFGAERDGYRAGSTGDLGVVSFHATKCLATGEGGMVLSKHPAIVNRLHRLKTGDIAERYRFSFSNLQAALGISQLRQYQGFLQRRQRIAQRYFDRLTGLPIRLPQTVRDRSIFFRFPLRHQMDFTRLQKAYDASGIQVRRGVDALLHRLFETPADGFPGAETLFKETLSLPIYPSLSDEQVDDIIQVTETVFGDRTVHSAGNE